MPEHRHSSIQLHQGHSSGGPHGSHPCPSPGQADIPAGPAPSSSPSTAPYPKPKSTAKVTKITAPTEPPQALLPMPPTHHLSHPPHHTDSCPGACFPKQQPCCVPQGVHPFGQGGFLHPMPSTVWAPGLGCCSTATCGGQMSQTGLGRGKNRGGDKEKGD